MTISNLKFQDGFTFIEVIIVIAIFAVLMLGLLNILDWHNKIFFLERADTQATGSLRTTMNNLTKYIAQASSVQSSHSFNANTYSTGSSTLVLQLPSYNSSGDLVSNTYDYIAYYLNGTTLYQTIETGSGSDRVAGTKVMSADVSSLTFTYDNSDVSQATKVTVDLTTSATSRGSSATTAHITNTIFLRNK